MSELFMTLLAGIAMGFVCGMRFGPPPQPRDERGRFVKKGGGA